MGNRWIWAVVGVVLLAGGVALVAVSINSFSRVPDAELGDTRDLALGLLCGLLALVTLAAGAGSIAMSRSPAEEDGEAGGDDLSDEVS